MDRQDKIIAITMLTVAALTSLMVLPQATTHIEAERAQASVRQSYFENLHLDAKAVYVYDLSNNKELYSKNANQTLPLASLSKIMTAVTASELANDPKTIVTIDPESLKELGDNNLYEWEQWELSRILQFMLVVSSNDAATAVANSLGGKESFVREMNAKAQKLSFNSLRFTNPSGLDETDNTAGSYGSAVDVAHLLGYAAKTIRSIIEPTRYATFQATSMTGFYHSVPNTDTIIGGIPGFIAGKTGYTNLAGGNLAIIFDAGFQHPVVIVVLGSTFDGRFTDVRSLVDASIKTISNQ
jgi:D-alanyl-D-alanine carboxypeptidase